jgi:hypothetical protein
MLAVRPARTLKLAWGRCLGGLACSMEGWFRSKPIDLKVMPVSHSQVSPLDLHFEQSGFASSPIVCAKSAPWHGVQWDVFA